MKKIIVLILMLLASTSAYSADLAQLKETAIDAIKNKAKTAIHNIYTDQELKLASLDAYGGTKNTEIKDGVKAIVSQAESAIAEVNSKATVGELKAWWTANAGNEWKDALGN